MKLVLRALAFVAVFGLNHCFAMKQKGIDTVEKFLEEKTSYKVQFNKTLKDFDCTFCDYIESGNKEDTVFQDIKNIETDVMSYKNFTDILRSLFEEKKINNEKYEDMHSALREEFLNSIDFFEHLLHKNIPENMENLNNFDLEKKTFVYEFGDVIASLGRLQKIYVDLINNTNKFTTIQIGSPVAYLTISQDKEKYLSLENENNIMLLRSKFMKVADQLQSEEDIKSFFLQFRIRWINDIIKKKNKVIANGIENNIIPDTLDFYPWSRTVAGFFFVYPIVKMIEEKNEGYIAHYIYSYEIKGEELFLASLINAGRELNTLENTLSRFSYQSPLVLLSKLPHWKTKEFLENIAISDTELIIKMFFEFEYSRMIQRSVEVSQGDIGSKIDFLAKYFTKNNNYCFILSELNKKFPKDDPNVKESKFFKSATEHLNAKYKWHLFTRVGLLVIGGLSILAIIGMLYKKRAWLKSFWKKWFVPQFSLYNLFGNVQFVPQGR